MKGEVVNANEYLHVLHMQDNIQRHFTIEASGDFFTLRPKKDLVQELDLSENANWAFTTLEAASSWVTGFVEGLMFARFADNRAQQAATKRKPALKKSRG